MITIIVILVLLTSFSAYHMSKKNTDINIIDNQDKQAKDVKISIEEFNFTLVTRNGTRDKPVCGRTKDQHKFECHPEPNPTEEKCLARGCCWSETNVADPNVPIMINEELIIYSVGVPPCYYPPNYSGYRLMKYRKSHMGIMARLQRITPSGFPLDIQEVAVEVLFLDNDKLNIKISDPNAVRYEVPFPKLNKVIKGRRDQPKHKYDVSISKGGVLKVTRNETGTDIFNANLATMVFANQLLQINIKVPFQGFYGIGEAEDVLLRGYDWKRYVLFNKDRQPEEGVNLYGSHPFYIQMENETGISHRAHGVLLFNSNSMDIVTQPSPGITFRPIGGVFDFYIFLGPTPGQVVQQYTDLIGHSFMPPYWSLGFHLCRYGYGSVEATSEVWLRNRNAKIPFDVQWNDIDYMEDYNDFTVDPVKFKTLGTFVKMLHSVGMHYVMIMDVGIGGPDLAGKYPPYDEAVEMDVLVKNITGDVFIGQVWNKGSTVFPDFTHPRAGEYMTKQYQRLHDIMEFDGSWTDMNEPSNFYDGSADGCPLDNPLENPPYVPGNLEPLRVKTLCMTAQHHASSHYNVHNIHGFTNVIATNTALKNVLKGRRPFIISRSSAPGVGFYGGHWDGDIRSTWEHYRWSIPSILNFGMFGVSMMGADICGFNGNTTHELCARWQATGAFYPFSRNHNTIGANDQDPAAMGGDVLEATRKALTIRYRLLPFLYTLFYKSHVFGETVARPLFFEYPDDPETYAIDSVFLWGPALMIIPVLQPGKTDVTAYIPDDTWYDYYKGSEVKSSGQVTFDAPITKINLLVRGGHILPTQTPALTTTESRNEKFGLIVALKDQKANGELYWDEGDTIDAYEQKAYNLIRFKAENQSMKSSVEYEGYKSDMVLGEIQILGTAGPKSKVTINGKDVINKYDPENKVLSITDLSQSLLEQFTLDWK